jgi:hypothetical protein
MFYSLKRKVSFGLERERDRKRMGAGFYSPEAKNILCSFKGLKLYLFIFFHWKMISVWACFSTTQYAQK